MKLWLTALVLAGVALCGVSQAAPLQLNGMAANEQLRKEYYIGALYLENRSKDSAAIVAQGGNKRMVLRITADRWSPMQFAQQWNQMILINNGGNVLNANVMDVLNFTSAPKSDLVAGDELAIHLDRGGTVVTLNDTTVVRTANPNLFNMLLNTWVGARPPSSEFKRDILSLPGDKAGADLQARFAGVKPTDARRKVTAAWGTKDAGVLPAIAATPTPAAPPPAPAPAAAAKPKVEPPTPAPAPAQAQLEPKAEPKKTPAPAVEKPVAAAPAPAAPPPAAEPKPAQPDSAALAAKKQQQDEMYAAYSNKLRRLASANIVYPKRAVKQSREGLVVLKVTVTRAGAVTSLGIAQSADSLLDAAALKAIQKAAFPPVDGAMEGSSFDFLIPVVFKLTEG